MLSRFTLRSLELLKIDLQAYLCLLKSINCLTPKFIWVDTVRFTIFNNELRYYVLGRVDWYPAGAATTVSARLLSWAD